MTVITLSPSSSADSEFQNAITSAKAAIRASQVGGNPLGTVVIELEAGDFNLSTLEVMMGIEGSPTNTDGLVFRGAGSGLTTVYFNPSTAGALCFNKGWIGVRFEGIQFIATTAGCTFLQSDVVSTSGYNAQDYIFTDCAWQGFKYVVDLIGDNNNSEFRFFGCETVALENAGAWLHIGATGTSDQFLNYWWYGCKHWSTSAALIQAHAGGHFNIFGLDASDWGAAGNSQLIQLYGSSHSYGVPSCTVQGLRAEIKSATSALLYSEWNFGNVVFQGCDIASQSFAYTYGPTVTCSFATGATILYSFRDCMMAGTLAIVGTPPAACSILFSSCNWFYQNSANDVCSNTFGSVVEFVRCNTATGGTTRWT